MSQGDFQLALQQLKQALYSHEQWHRDIIRSIVCRMPYDLRDTQPDAHRQCRFGQWYYSETSSVLRVQAGFAAIETEHKRMHEFAAHMLITLAQTDLIKPEDYDNFTNSVERLRLEMQSLISELEYSLYKLDPLTGAENRVEMLPVLRQELALVQRNAHASSIMIMDLDHFKRINDTHGHVVGDSVLAAAVRYAKTILRPYDRIFRYGGEEFLVLLPQTSLDEAQAVAERIREALHDQVLAHDHEVAVSITTSAGVGLLEPNLTVEESITRADTALYAAKQGGRNQVRVSAPASPFTAGTS